MSAKTTKADGVLRKTNLATLMRKSVVALIPLYIVGVIACSDDNPTSSDNGNGNGNGADSIAPAVVSDLHTASPSQSSIAVVWTAPGDDGNAGTASEYDLRFSKSPITDQSWDAATPVDDVGAPKPAGQIETVVVLNLESAQEYYFALKTSDEVPNVSALSNVAAGSTKQETIPPSAVTDLSAEGIEEGSFRLTWTAPGDDGNQGDAFEYDIRYSTAPFSENTWDSANQIDGETAPKPAGSPDTMVVTGLEAGTNYFFAMKTADEAPNWSAISNLYPALASENNLWVFPERVKEGNNLTLIYRIPETGLSKLHAHYRFEENPWRRLLIEWEWPPGVHTMEWDFKRGGEYHYNPYTYYTFKLYWDSVVVGEAITLFQQ